MHYLRWLIVGIARRGLLDWVPNSIYLRIVYRLMMKKSLNLESPQTFNEKLQYLKVYDYKPEYTQWVDKIRAKKLVMEILGEQYVVPILGVWDKAEQIDFGVLPDKFVLKCSHDQGSVVLCDKTKKIDEKAIRAFLNLHLKLNIYRGTREYPYKNIKPKILCEKYLGANIVDYKFHCFNGKPLFLYVGQGLTADHSLKIDFFSVEWQPMPFYRTDYRRLGNAIARPKQLKLMTAIAEKLSAGTRFVRIDLFEVNNQVYFSEYTLYPGSGYMPFVPEEYDEIVGSWLEL